MNREEFIATIKYGVQKAEVETALERVYHHEIPKEIISILSCYPAPELFDENESRTLSLKEVLNAEENLRIPFKSKGIIPIVDTGDNDYIVYCLNDKTWRFYNILDKSLFYEKGDIEDLFML